MLKCCIKPIWIRDYLYGVNSDAGVIATAATNVNGDSFTANWDAYAGATMYFLDVSTSSNFATYILQNQVINAPSTSYNVTGLAGCTTYYYRVRALVGVFQYSLQFNNFLNSGYISLR